MPGVRSWKAEPLGTLEAEVMDHVWAAGPLTARELCQRMKGRKERAYTTVMTTMDRLHRKGLLRREKDGLAWRYFPALTREGFKRAAADQLAVGILTAHGERGLAAFVDAAAEVDQALLDRLAQLVAARRGKP
jgi:predicted transcriptional regulator